MFSRVSVVSLAVAAALASAGCLQKEVTHTIYIAPSGVTWTSLEKDVRSDESDASKRADEERGFVAAVDSGAHPVALALEGLGASQLTTTWIRRERPYTVMTEGRFTDLRQLTMAILREARIGGDASLVKTGCRTTFTVRVKEESDSDQNGDKAIDALISDLSDYRFVLTRGRFVEADGFLIAGDGTVATADKEKTPVDGVLTLRLVWTDEGC